MPDTKTFTGSCHCGKVRFEVTTDLASVIACNCSICSKKASLLNFVPRPQFKLLSGENDTREYRFNKQVIEHRFCTTCGIHPFAYGAMPDGTKIAAVNVRCLDGVDPNALTVTNYDGRSR